MRCPVCDCPLRRPEGRGIELRRCPRCRGAWLARRELESLFGPHRPARTAPSADPAAALPAWAADIEFYDFG